MVYQTNWIEKNMGISRKAIDTYEKHGFIRPAKNPNNGKYREFDEEDLQCIWIVNFYVKLGFSLEEIKALGSDPDLDLHKLLEEKIEEMEAEKERLEQRIGLAKYMKMTGLLPIGPKEMGTVTVEEFMKYSCETLGVHADPQDTMMYDMLQFMSEAVKTTGGWNEEAVTLVLEKIFEKPEEEWEIEELEEIFGLLAGIDKTIIEQYYHWKKVASLSDHEVSHPDVQAAMKETYEYEKEHVYDNSDTVTPQWYAEHTYSSFTGSDLAVSFEISLGRENCKFIAKAIEYFGIHAEESTI